MRIARKLEWKAGRPLFALAGVALVGTLAACGGGIVDDDDGGGEADHLTCATECKPSSSLATNQIRAHYVVVGDGTKVQARATFSSGRDPRTNVELDGNDSLRLVTPQGTQGFYIPAGSKWTMGIDALVTLLTGAKPYLSEVDPPSAATQMQFQLVRGTTATYVATVDLPAPFRITSPASGLRLPVTTRSLPVQLTSPVTTPHNIGRIECTDVNGNKGSGSENLSMVSGSLTADATSVSYSLALDDVIDAVEFSTDHPRGAVERCDLELEVVYQNDGLPDPGFASTLIYAQQIRKVKIALR